MQASYRLWQTRCAGSEAPAAFAEALSPLTISLVPGWQGPAQAKKLVRGCKKIFKKKN